MMPEDAQRIHDTSLALLDDPGIRLEHREIGELLLERGAAPGRDPDVLRIPASMVDEALKACPRQVTLHDRAGGARVLTATSGSAVWSCPGMNLSRGGEHRPFSRKDMADLARLLDRLDQVHGVFGLAMSDVVPGQRDVVGLKTIAANTRKHIRVLCFSPEGAEALTRIKPLAEGAWFSVGFTAHGPLRWTFLALEIYRRTAGHGIPASINGEPMAGATGPVTLAGAAAVGNAEILAGLVVNQLLEPGRPCVYNLGLAHVFDMRTATAVTGGPENHLLAGVSAAMGRFYDLPAASWVSTEAMLPDAQAAIEKTAGYLTHRQSGVANIWGFGQLESELTVSPAQAVIDNEILRYVDRLMRPVAVDDDTLALDVTRDVGIGGHFLEHDHTMRHFREELFMPELLFRGQREHWQSRGAETLSERAEQVADRLIAEPIEPGLDEDQRRALDQLVPEP